MSRNQISDITPLAGLTQLRSLALGNNHIRDVSPLAGLLNLRTVQLLGNPIEDTSPLSSLENLKDVDIEIAEPTPEVASAAPTAVATGKTVLLANYPNLLNPETWIPYQLAKPAEVTRTSYAADGTVVRILALGYQSAGFYQSDDTAAYWDGRNAVGAPVASGVYNIDPEWKARLKIFYQVCGECVGVPFPSGQELWKRLIPRL